MAYSTEYKALLALGYSLVSIKNRLAVFPQLIDNDDLLYVDGYLARLDDIDTKLTVAIADSMAVKVQDLTLDYQQHIRQLEDSGSRLLQELATMLSVAVVRDKYRLNGSSAIKAVRNYF